MKVLSDLFWRTWMEPWSRRTRCLPQKRQAVGRLAEAGIFFAITSGRPPRGMQTLIRDLNITTVIAGFNGGVYTTPRLDPIAMRDLPKTATARAIEIIREGGLVAWLYTDTVWYVQDPKGPHVERESKTVGFGPEVTSDYSAYVAQAPKIVGVGDDLEAVANCESATVFIFPDPNTGNTPTKQSKGVPRSSASARCFRVLIKRPVNDLSRGALVDNIAYTIALTAVQATQ
jgi:haloacid dehalogenase-like hydrolase/phosphate acetyl/butyryl transferase